MVGSGVADDRDYYLIPRRLAHVVLTALLATMALTVGGLWILGPLWLPSIAYALDAEVSIAHPDAIVLRSAATDAAPEQLAARAFREGQTGAIVLLGEPFTPDALDPARQSRRFGRLVSLGVPPEAIFEVYEGERLDDEMRSLGQLAGARGWRSLQFVVVTPGTRRHLIVARRVLAPLGLTIGQTALPGPDYEPHRWWANERDRGRVIMQWIVLLYAAIGPG